MAKQVMIVNAMDTQCVDHAREFAESIEHWAIRNQVCITFANHDDYLKFCEYSKARGGQFGESMWLRGLED